MSNMTGRLLVGRYRLGRLIDEAALGSTYEAHDVETREEVAVELLTRPNGAGLPSARRLRREARRIVDTTHVGLRTARTIGVEGGVPFIIAEPVRGESLKHRLTRRGPLPIADCLAVALQIIDALATAHAGGIVHGNLEPEKIRLVVEPTGATVAKVMGLGVTTLLGTMRDVDTRRLGTPAYLAPEQLTDPGAPGSTGGADELTDVWGVGLLLFEMLTGRRAFDGATAEELGRQISAAGLVKVRPLRATVPIALEHVVGATLARKREQRLSLRDLRRALLEVQAAYAASSRVVRVPATGKLPDLSDPCDDAEGPTDLHVHVETDLGSL